MTAARDPLTPADLAAIEETKIQRWDLEFVHDYSEARVMVKSEYGDWVDHDDHVAAVAALLAEVRRLQAIVDAGFGPECNLAAIRESDRATAAVSGYRRDVDNCLGELRHKNAVLRDRDAEIGRLRADNERMRRGLEYISKRGPGSVDGECTDCESQCVDQARAAVNLLAGREWSDAEGK